MGNPLRVLHVVVNMNRGGAETLIMNLYRNIDRTRIQFDFLTSKAGVFDEEITAMGGKVYRVPYITDTGPFGYQKEMEHFFHTHPDYRVVHSHLDKMSGLVLRSARKANVPVRISHSHNTKSEGGTASKLYKWYAGTQIRSSATHFYACSNAAAAWLFGEESNQAFILKNGIELEKFQFSEVAGRQIRRELGIDKDTLVLGHVGRFSPQKNHLFLLEVFAGIVKQLPNTVLLLAGDGPLRSKIEEKIKEFHLTGKVRLLGVREDIHLLLQAFNMFLFPSLHEGLPVTLVEAQAAGLPCLVADTITNEVNMGDGMLHYASLIDKSEWIRKTVLLVKNMPERKILHESLVEKGYDIRQTAATTQVFYLMMERETT